MGGGGGSGGGTPVADRLGQCFALTPKGERDPLFRGEKGRKSRVTQVRVRWRLARFSTPSELAETGMYVVPMAGPQSPLTSANSPQATNCVSGSDYGGSGSSSSDTGGSGGGVSGGGVTVPGMVTERIFILNPPPEVTLGGTFGGAFGRTFDDTSSIRTPQQQQQQQQPQPQRPWQPTCTVKVLRGHKAKVVPQLRDLRPLLGWWARMCEVPQALRSNGSHVYRPRKKGVRAGIRRFMSNLGLTSPPPTVPTPTQGTPEMPVSSKAAAMLGISHTPRRKEAKSGFESKRD